MTNLYHYGVRDVKYKTGQTLCLRDGYELHIEYADGDVVDYSLWAPPSAVFGSFVEVEDYDIPESTIDAIIAHHNRR